jgi:4-amino-4-deoxy-L-arabinose transferase-like glycosyltransferase
LSFPNLGKPSLWDIDEGNNAEAAREMLASGNWIVPTFNYQLRVDKPALLYWLQIFAYRSFGVNEFAARLPSALAALVTVLITYELGRRLFGAASGLISGVILSTSIAFCASAHFANPDALLNSMVALTLFIFWRGFSSNGRWWFLGAGISTGLAVLAKGPVGLVLPAGVVFLFLVWSRKLAILRDRRLISGILLFLLVAIPWYVWVGVDTKASFLRGFLFQHNVGRYLHPMEHHAGPIYYYFLVLLIGFAPWSIFLWQTVWFAVGERGRKDECDLGGPVAPALRYRFLWCWIAVCFLFFSLAGTKLPNYILPIYAPLAILSARCLDRWRTQAIDLPAWNFKLAMITLVVVGIGIALTALLIGRVMELPFTRGWPLNGLERLAVLGVPFIVGAIAVWWCVAKRQRTNSVVLLAGTAALFACALFAWGAGVLDAGKAPRELIEASGACQPKREIRVGCYQYFQPSLVFYCGREVQRFESEQEAQEFLRSPLQVYLFLPASQWQELKANAPLTVRQIASHADLFRRCEVAVVTNR